MRMRAFAALVMIGAALPGLAVAAGDSPQDGAPAFDDVPTLPLNPPPGRSGGWGANGWQGAPSSGAQPVAREHWANGPGRSAGGPVARPRLDRGRDRLARAYDEGYDDGYGDGHDDGVDYARDPVSSGGGWRHGPVRGRGGPAHVGSYGGPSSAYPGEVHVETYRSGPYTYAAGPGTQVFGRPDGTTVVVIQSAPATTGRTVTYETVSTGPARKRTSRKR